MNYSQYNYQLTTIPIIHTSAQPVLDQPAVMVQPYANTNQQTTQFVPHQNNPNWIMCGYRAPILSANGYTPMSPGQIQYAPVLQSSVNEVTHPLVLEISQDERQNENLSIPNFAILIEQPVDNANNSWIVLSNQLTPPPSPASGNSEKPTQRQQRIRNKDGPKRFRTAYTAEQLAALEKFYVGSDYIKKTDRFKMSDDLQIPEGKIKTWFQNRRMKSKKRLSNSGNAVSSQKISVRNHSSVSPVNSTAAVGNQTQQRATTGNMHQPVVNVNQGQQHTPVGNGPVPTVNNYYDSNLDQFLGGYNQGEVEITAEIIPLP